MPVTGARQDSDIDLLVAAPEGTSSFDFLRFKQLVEQILGREVDLVSYGGLKPKFDDDISREAVLLVMDRKAAKELLHIKGVARPRSQDRRTAVRTPISPTTSFRRPATR